MSVLIEIPPAPQYRHNRTTNTIVIEDKKTSLEFCYNLENGKVFLFIIHNIISFNYVSSRSPCSYYSECASNIDYS